MTYDGIDCILFTAENCLKRKNQLEKELAQIPSSGTVVMYQRVAKRVPYVHYYENGKMLSKRVDLIEADKVRLRMSRCKKPSPKGKEGDNEYRPEDKIHLSKRREHMRYGYESFVGHLRLAAI